MVVIWLWTFDKLLILINLLKPEITEFIQKIKPKQAKPVLSDPDIKNTWKVSIKLLSPFCINM